jgi:hypothetical protein
MAIAFIAFYRRNLTVSSLFGGHTVYNMLLRLEELEYGYESIQLFNHRIDSLQKADSAKQAWLLHATPWFAICTRHVPSQCAYESHSPPWCPPFWIYSGGKWLSLRQSSFEYAEVALQKQLVSARLIRFKLENVLPKVYLSLLCWYKNYLICNYIVAIKPSFHLVVSCRWHDKWLM